ncbi:hypothetical protein AAG906_022270 [Vitis piasezkii]
MIEWDSHKHMILTWIEHFHSSISNRWGFDDAKSAWDMLAKRYSTTHGSTKYRLVVELHQLKQEPGQSINDYYDQLRFIWDQIDLSDPTWTCSKDAQQYASIRDEFRLYEFLMSLHKDFEPIRGQLLNRLVREEARLATLQARISSINPKNRVILMTLAIVKRTNKSSQLLQASSHTIETCYRRNKSTAAVANIEPTPPMASTSEIIAQAVRMAGNASLSLALSVLHLGFVSTFNLSFLEGGSLGPVLELGVCFVSNLHLPLLLCFYCSAAAVSSLPSFALWHSRLGHASSSRVPLSKMVEPKENFVIFLTLFVLCFFLPKFLPHFGVKRLFMLFMQLTVFQVLSSIIRLRMSVSLGHPLSIITFAHLDLLVLFFFSLMSTTNLSLALDSVVSLVMVKLKRGIGVMILSLIVFVFLVMLSFGNIDCCDEQLMTSYPTLRRVPYSYSEDPPQDIPPRHSTRVRSIRPHLLDYHCYTPCYTSRELDALTKNHTWDLVPLPPGQSVVGCKWIYKIKTRSDGSVERYKARLVAKGFTQEYGIDYEETFAPVARISSVRALLAVAAARQWDLFQMDVKNAFLNGDLSEAVYMQPPPGLSVESNKVCHLRRALYGLKQAPRAWFAKFSSTIFRLGYTASPYDSALFLRRTDKGTILLLLYVDDMIITGNDLSGIQELKDFLGQFEMKDLGHLTISGLEITHSIDGLYITQANEKNVDTLIELNAIDTLRKPLSNPSLLTIGWRLVYLTITCPTSPICSSGEPDLCSTINSLSLLRILRYRRVPFSWPFLLSSISSCTPCILDLDWAEILDRKTNFCDPPDLERISCPCDTTSELLWLRWLLKDLGSAIHIAHNDVFHEQTKHIEIDCHFIRYHLVHGALKLFFSLPTRRTRDLIDNLKLVSHPP